MDCSFNGLNHFPSFLKAEPIINPSAKGKNCSRLSTEIPEPKIIGIETTSLTCLTSSSMGSLPVADPVIIMPSDKKN